MNRLNSPSTEDSGLLSSPNPVSALPLNKTAQFAFGVLILFVAAKLWWSGWFSFRLMHATGIEPVAAADMTSPIGLLPFVIDSVCFVGILGFVFLSFVRGLVGPLLAGIRGWTAETLQPGAAQDVAAAPGRRVSTQQIDPNKLKQILEDFKARIVLLEELHPELVPPAPPTIEELMEEVQRLRKRVNQQGKPSPDPKRRQGASE